ncbi:hypothetical protein DFJ74DRAFT_646583 [Hyaloraphidium curvatum]|nr:hypothetical protein DFJ74DRAFT_646583 [Hyaloraphidium curvatum]
MHALNTAIIVAVLLLLAFQLWLDKRPTPPRTPPTLSFSLMPPSPEMQATWRRQSLVAAPNFLLTPIFLKLAGECLALVQSAAAKRSPAQVAALRSGVSVPASHLQGTLAEALYASCQLRDWLRTATGNPRMDVVRTDDPTRMTLIAYDRPGDSIAWHVDGNHTAGQRVTMLICLANRGREGGVSCGKLQYMHADGHRKTVDLVENSMINITVNNFFFGGSEPERPPATPIDFSLVDFVPAPLDSMRLDVVIAKYDPSACLNNQPVLVRYLNNYVARYTGEKAGETFYYRRMPAARWMQRTCRQSIGGDLMPFWPPAESDRDGGRDRDVDLLNVFLRSTDRREFKEVCYDPSHKGDNGRTLNLFSGLAARILPKEKVDETKFKRMNDHYEQIICSNDRTLSNELFNWMAYIVQERDKTGVATAFIGAPGAGKNIAADFFRLKVIGEANSPKSINKVPGSLSRPAVYEASIFNAAKSAARTVHALR